MVGVRIDQWSRSELTRAEFLGSELTRAELAKIRIVHNSSLAYQLLLGNKTVISWVFDKKSKQLPLGASDDHDGLLPLAFGLGQ